MRDAEGAEERGAEGADGVVLGGGVPLSSWSGIWGGVVHREFF